ncbi:MAG: hypothetical protein N2316_05630 [Spirochaetes bacterium]|nr:hypothetical protein [Spirochaetota bacterium]
MAKLKNYVVSGIIYFMCACGPSHEEIFLSGTIDIQNVKNNLTGPLMLIVTTTADIAQLQSNPQESIVGIFGINPDDPYYRVEIGSLGKKSGEVVYLFAFIDADFNGMPSPDTGDFVGFYINRNTYEYGYELQKGENRNLDIRVNRMLRDFNAQIIYAIDKGDVTYGKEFNVLITEEVVIAVHEKGMQIALTSAGTYEVKIDPDYILGFARFQPPVFDVYEGPRPKPYETPKALEVIPAIHVEIPIENEKIAGKVYLVAIIDENSNGKIEVDDDVGFYPEKINVLPGTCFEVPGYGKICPPPGEYYYPKGIYVQRGENRDASNDNEPYWIVYRIYQPTK